MQPEIIAEIIVTLLSIFMGILSVIGGNLIYKDPFNGLPYIIRIIMSGMLMIIGVVIMIGIPLYFIGYN